MLAHTATASECRTPVRADRGSPSRESTNSQAIASFLDQLEPVPSVSGRLRERTTKRRELPRKLLTAFWLIVLGGTSAGLSVVVCQALRGSDWRILLAHFGGGIVGALVAGASLASMTVRSARLWAVAPSDVTNIVDPNSEPFWFLLAIVDIAAAGWATVGLGFKVDFDWFIFVIALMAAVASGRLATSNRLPKT